MQYNNYLEKIKKRAAFLSKLYTHMIFLLVGTVVVVASVCSLVAAKGTITEDGDCPPEIVYGEVPTYAVDAIMGKVTFEYSRSGSGEWTSEPPMQVGEYLVRAVSKTAFGGHKYGREQVFTVKPREIVLAVKDSTIVYGDIPALKSVNLHKGDKLDCSFVYDDITKKNTSVWVDVSSVKITNDAGADVTGNYAIVDIPHSDIAITPRTLTVTVDSKTEIYNNKVVYCKGYEAREGDLVNGDIVVAVSTPAEIIEVGSKTNTYEFKAVTPDGKNISGHYSITVIPGTLTVEKRPLHITTSSDEKVYDGQPLQNLDFTLDDADKAFLDEQGHIISATGGTSVTDVKDSGENQLFFEIVDKNNQSIEHNYDYSMFLTLGTLTVEKRQITVTTESYDEKFDGESHTLSNVEFKPDDVVDGHEVSPVGVETFKDAVNTQNMHTVIIHDNGGTDVTGNYEITYEYGVVVISKRDITIKTTTPEKAYSYQDKWFKCEEYTIIEDGVEYLSYEYPFKISGTYAQIKERGNIPNAITSLSISYNGSPVDINKNFNVTREWGTLTVTEAQITLAFGVTEWTYGYAAPATVDKKDGVKIIDGGLITGHSYEVNWQLGSDVKNFEEGGYSIKIRKSDVVIKDASGKPVTDNYIINFEDGEQEAIAKAMIKKRPITLQANSKTWVYDSYEHTLNDPTKDYTIVSGSWAYDDKNKIEVNIVGSVTNVSDNAQYNNRLTAVYSDDYTSANYDFTLLDGTLRIEPYEITVTSKGDTWEYDGTYKSYNEKEYSDAYTLSRNDLPVNDNFVITLDTEIRDVGDMPNYISYSITRGGVDVSRNYTVITRPGTLTITPRKLTITTEGAKKVYDGTPISNSDMTIAHVGGGDVWGVGDTPTVYTTTQFTYVIRDSYNNPIGTPNAFFLSIKDNTNIYSYEFTDNTTSHVLGNYEITVELGELKITPRKMLLSTESQAWTYDADSHFNHNYTYANQSDGGANDWENDVWNVDVIGTITNAGSVDNEIDMDALSIYALNGDDVTACYDIETKWGTLTVHPRAVYITINPPALSIQYSGYAPDYSGTGFWLYSGQSASNTAYQIVSGQTLSINVACIEHDCEAGHGVGSSCLGCVGTHKYDMISFNISGTNADGSALENENYVIECNESFVEIQPIAITITPDEMQTTHIYSGSVPYFYSYIITGEIAGGQELTTYFYPVDCEDGNVGTYNIEFSAVKITDANGRDMTHNYDITRVKDGYSIKIDPRPITIQAKDVSAYQYDGKAPIFNGTAGWEYASSSERLVAGHTINAVVKCKGGHACEIGVHGTPSECCGCVGRHSLVIDSYELSGTDESNYIITCSPDAGYCEIMPRKITVTTDSAVFKYQAGVVNTNKGYSSSNGLAGHFIDVNVTGEITDVGSAQNTCELVGVYSDDDVDRDRNLMGNYTVTEYKLGTLTVIDFVEITMKGASRTYTGHEIIYTKKYGCFTLKTNDEFVIDFQLNMVDVGNLYVHDGKLWLGVDDNGDGIDDSQIPYSGYYLNVYHNGVLLDLGMFEDDFDDPIITFVSAKAANEPVVVISKKVIVFTAPTESVVYDDTVSLEENYQKFQKNVEITGGQLLSGHTFGAKDPDLKLWAYVDGIKPTKDTPAAVKVNIDNIRIEDENGMDVTHNYEIIAATNDHEQEIMGEHRFM